MTSTQLIDDHQMVREYALGPRHHRRKRAGPEGIAGHDQQTGQGVDMTTGWRKSTFSADNSYCVKIRFDGPTSL